MVAEAQANIVASVAYKTVIICVSLKKCMLQA